MQLIYKEIARPAYFPQPVGNPPQSCYNLWRQTGTPERCFLREGQL